ncbi:MAG TPA: nuclear transport factor 2 family protein [Sphingomonas sp.]|nr:nuclear transport factor 2 family protein [Sphingomonas sp.]
MNDDLARRVDRLESIDAIRQPAAQHALALDMRDADAWVGVFPEDVKVGKGVTGRAALRDWFFRRCLPLYWYATDLNKPPIGPNKMRWPGEPPYEGGYHDYLPSWRAFWDRAGPSDAPVPEPAPLERFLEAMRANGPPPSVRVR